MTTCTITLTTDAAPTCTNCGGDVALDDETWYHDETMRAWCDPEGEENLTRQAEPAPTVWAATLTTTDLVTNFDVTADDPQDALRELADAITDLL